MQRIIRIIIFGFIAGIAISWKLWFLGDRGFPILPFPDWVQGNSFTDIVLSFGLIFTFPLILAFIYPKKEALRPVLIGIVLLVLFDQMRLQPWVYMYFFLLLPFTLFTENKKSIYLPYLQIILVCMYIWSGIHKLNPNFIEITFSDILRHLFAIEIAPGLRAFGYIIPLTEIVTGLLLIIPICRKWGVRFAVLTHLIIMLYLSPAGINDNHVVIPWNFTLALLVIVLFWNEKNSLSFWKQLRGYALGLTSVALLLFGLLPSLNFVGGWDDFLSFSLYSDKVKRYYIAVEASQVSRIDKNIHPYFVQIEGMQGGEMIDINEWAMEELNVPFYPERSALRKLSKHLCQIGIPDEKLLFIEYQQPIRENIFWSKTCSGINEK